MFHVAHIYKLPVGGTIQVPQSVNQHWLMSKDSASLCSMHGGPTLPHSEEVVTDRLTHDTLPLEPPPHLLSPLGSCDFGTCCPVWLTTHMMSVVTENVCMRLVHTFKTLSHGHGQHASQRLSADAWGEERAFNGIKRYWLWQRQCILELIEVSLNWWDWIWEICGLSLRGCSRNCDRDWPMLRGSLFLLLPVLTMPSLPYWCLSALDISLLVLLQANCTNFQSTGREQAHCTNLQYGAMPTIFNLKRGWSIPEICRLWVVQVLNCQTDPRLCGLTQGLGDRVGLQRP